MKTLLISIMAFSMIAGVTVSAGKRDARDVQNTYKTTQVKLRFDDVHPFSEGMAKVELNGKTGYINERGQIVIQPQFEILETPNSDTYAHGNFSNGLAVVRTGSYSYGYINKKGKIVIELNSDDTFQYEVSDFSDGLAIVWSRGPDYGEMWFINTKGEHVLSAPPHGWCQDFSDDDLGVCFNGKAAGAYYEHKAGFYNKNGQWVIEPQFDRAYPFSEGLAAVGFEGKYGYYGWGFINKKGEYVIKIQFPYVASFSEGLAAVRLKGGNGKYGFINKTGEVVIEPQFRKAKSFSGDRAAVQLGGKDGKWGFIDKQGQTVVQPQFDDVRSFSKGKAAVKLNGKWGFIDKKGQTVVQPQFDDVRSFSEGKAAVKLNGKWGFINKQGKIIF